MSSIALISWWIWSRSMRRDERLVQQRDGLVRDLVGGVLRLVDVARVNCSGTEIGEELRERAAALDDLCGMGVEQFEEPAFARHQLAEHGIVLLRPPGGGQPLFCQKPRGARVRRDKKGPDEIRPGVDGGDEGDRTLDLRIANATLSQLSYVPTLVPARAGFYNGLAQNDNWNGRRSGIPL